MKKELNITEAFTMTPSELVEAIQIRQTETNLLQGNPKDLATEFLAQIDQMRFNPEDTYGTKRRTVNNAWRDFIKLSYE